MAQNLSDGSAVQPSDASDQDVRERFERSVAPLRRELHAHCYRMLGSVFDADDALQEGLVRAWRAFDGFEGRSSLRTWLYTVVTRACIDAAAARRRRALPVDLGPASSGADRGGMPREDVLWLTPYPDPADVASRMERLEVAFIAALQHLTGNERAALLLVDVLGFSAAEAAESLGATPTAVHSALARARRRLAGTARPHAVAPRPSAPVLSLARRFADALTSSDVDAFVALLARDVTWQMPPLAEWYSGVEAVASFAQAVPMTLCPSWRTRVLTANGHPAVAFYLGQSADGPHRAWSLTLLAASGHGRVESIVSFLEPALFERFGLPAEID
ncbi:RNA polymerase subunit sigma-70 [Microbacterium marinilacus]|uniref:Sigma-70 family RNA polymerase sigma factor SigG n=1 Tax=Microbacterium marinilacus TaxID=415209 RepID=A0ABP7BF37_9MICO|nr:RNA polymerase subunit sigma-70 [Microbacterium marinilacus]MBY0689613.1 RNA polymerase subunit sigma-70 [Microbacterium marinilacus]